MYAILTAEEKTRHGVNRLVTWRYEFAIIAAWFLEWEFGLTTSLTIYRFGLRGNSATGSTRKHRFRTKKHQKVNKSSQKRWRICSGTGDRGSKSVYRLGPSCVSNMGSHSKRSRGKLAYLRWASGIFTFGENLHPRTPLAVVLLFFVDVDDENFTLRSRMEVVFQAKPW